MRVVVLVAGQPAAQVALARRGGFERWIREQAADGDGSDVEWATHDLRTDGLLPGRRAADAFVVTGSSSSVTERAPWMLRAERLVREIAGARPAVPLLGICFGHQMIAQALGGDVERNPFGREIGTVRLARVADDPIFAGLPRAFDVNATHLDAVTRLPAGARLLAATALDPAAAFAVGEAIRAVQFHPEFDADVMRRYLRARASAVEAEGADLPALIARVHERTRGRDVLRNFVRSFVRRRGWR